MLLLLLLYSTRPFVYSFIQDPILAGLFCIGNQYRSQDECRFLHQLESDLYEFRKASVSNAVLLLPPLSSTYRFLVHKFVEEKVPGLSTVSIGEGTQRRTAIYIKQQRYLQAIYFLLILYIDLLNFCCVLKV